MLMPERRIRVMLVDDFAGMHAAVERLLIPWCEIVGAVTDSSTILAEATRLAPEVIVLDLRMPGTNGLTLCHHLMAAVPASRIVLYSAQYDPTFRDLALEAGAVDFVSKDRLVDDLLPAILRASAR